MRELPDLIGETFGRLTVVAKLPRSSSGKKRLSCLCECGELVAVGQDALRKGATKSCGCLRKEVATRAATKHGKAVPGRETYLYKLWQNVKARAVSGSASHSECWVARGITVYPAWVANFSAFESWIQANLGPRPDGYSLDRLDNDGDYEPGNLRWATAAEQNNNSSRNVVITFNGEALNLAQWSKRLAFSRGVLWNRLFRYGWPIEKALTTPTATKRKLQEKR